MSGMHFEDFHQFIICGGMKPGKSTFLKYIKNLQQENARLKEENFNFEEAVKLCRCERYKQALQEIKEIAENCYDPADKENDSLYHILQKIAECEVDNER